jgi:hypothetical protein
MAQHYTAREFFRQTPNALLKRYFLARGALSDFDFEAMPETKPDTLTAAWNGLEDRERAEMDAEFSEIFALACQKGFLAILDEVRWRWGGDAAACDSLIEKLAALPGHFERAMTVFLDHKECWRAASLFYHADSLSWWRKRRNFPTKSAALDRPSRADLAKAIGDWFRTFEGRGRNCLVETLRRGDRDYFFAYPEDHGQQAMEWVEGEFSRRPHNPAFEVVYIWSERDGALEINHRGPRQALQPLQEIFARHILRLDSLPPDPKDERIYDLDALRHRDFQFVYTPDSGVQSVVVRKLRLSSRLRVGDRILVEANTEENALALYDVLEEIGRSVPLDQWNVTQAEISARISLASDRPSKVTTFRIGWPNSCSLKFDDIGLKLRAMLQATGIEPH